MKKLFLLSFVCFLGITTMNAQEQAIKVNPIGLAFGIANAGYEFSINDTQTLTIAGVYVNISDTSGFGAGAEYRFYFSDEALRGWHAGPSVSYFTLEDDFNNSAGFFSVGGEAGHQWILGEHFVVDVFAGIGFVSGSSDDLIVSVSSTAVSIGASIGYAW